MRVRVGKGKGSITGSSSRGILVRRRLAASCAARGHCQHGGSKIVRRHGSQVRERPDTLFVGALHDTTTETVTIYETDHPSAAHAGDLKQALSWLSAATVLGANAPRACRGRTAHEISRGAHAIGPRRGQNGDLPDARPSSPSLGNPCMTSTGSFTTRFGSRSLSRPHARRSTGCWSDITRSAHCSTIAGFISLRSTAGVWPGGMPGTCGGSPRTSASRMPIGRSSQHDRLVTPQRVEAEAIYILREGVADASKPLLMRTVPNPQSRKVWREKGEEREFRDPRGRVRCGGVIAEARRYGF